MPAHSGKNKKSSKSKVRPKAKAATVKPKSKAVKRKPKAKAVTVKKTKAKTKKVVKKVVKKVAKKKAAKKRTSKNTGRRKAKKTTRVSRRELSEKLKWIAVVVSEGFERQASTAISRVADVYEVLVPEYEGDLLYSSYVFVGCILEEDALASICELPNIDGILTSRGAWNYSLMSRDAADSKASASLVPVELSDTELQAIRKSSTIVKQNARTNISQVEVGQKIIITTGIFEGMNGTVKKVYRRQMAVVAEIQLSEGGMARMARIKHGDFDIVKEDHDDDGWQL